MDVVIRLLLRFILVPLGAALAAATAAAFVIVAHRNALLAVANADSLAHSRISSRLSLPARCSHCCCRSGPTTYA
jgi:hypothetical protein